MTGYYPPIVPDGQEERIMKDPRLRRLYHEADQKFQRMNDRDKKPETVGPMP